MNLKDSVSTLKGVGPKRAAALEAQNIRTVADFLRFLPISYQDKTVCGSFADTTGDPVTVLARITKKGAVRRYNGRSLFILSAVDDTGADAEILFFNQPYLLQAFEVGARYYFYSKITVHNGKRQLYSPAFAHESKKSEFLKIAPVYAAVPGFPQKSIETCITAILRETGLTEYLPEHLLETYGLSPLTQTYGELHHPTSRECLERAKTRLKFEEGLKIHMGILSARRQEVSTEVTLTNFDLADAFVRALPFALTGAQQRVLTEIFEDLKKDRAMNRMIQGDVGSGKTIIAVVCAYLMAVNGYQCAYMAPTEVLAAQHEQTFRRFLEPYGISVGLLCGAQTGKTQQQIRGRLKDGSLQVIVGTHALIQEQTSFYNLGLIITDEQHRFGVRQRGQFGHKGRAHALVMSATPIPRTLALTLYGDLDCSVIDELPAGRKKIHTYFYTKKALGKILKFTAGQIAQGRQAFVVCPFVEDSETLEDVASATRTYEEIARMAGKHIRVDLLHGKMSAQEKEKAVDRFNTRATDLLVATTIVEVGIDVPNVSVMIILNAERFGLSQLHQLRGRAGRGAYQSYCFLVSDNKSEQTIERMKVIVNCHDGQKIAEEDFRLRGPGDYFGFRQHGFGGIGLLDPVRDKQLFEQTRTAALALCRSGRAEDMRCKDRLLRAFDEDTRDISMN